MSRIARRFSSWTSLHHGASFHAVRKDVDLFGSGEPADPRGPACRVRRAADAAVELNPDLILPTGIVAAGNLQRITEFAREPSAPALYEAGRHIAVVRASFLKAGVHVLEGRASLDDVRRGLRGGVRILCAPESREGVVEVCLGRRERDDGGEGEKREEWLHDPLIMQSSDVSKPDDVTSVSWIGAGWLFPRRPERRRESASSCRTESALSFRRTSLKTCGRRRTWHCVQPPARASESATPLRCFASCSNSAMRGPGDLSGEGSAVGGLLLQLSLELAALGLDRLPLARDLRLLRFERGIRGLQLRRERFLLPPCARAADPRARGRPVPPLRSRAASPGIPCWS